MTDAPPLTRLVELVDSSTEAARQPVGHLDRQLDRQLDSWDKRSCDRSIDRLLTATCGTALAGAWRRQLIVVALRVAFLRCLGDNAGDALERFARVQGIGPFGAARIRHAAIHAACAGISPGLVQFRI